ncbi:hypothetical protein AB1L88_05800 [Tautonia sp. JC769]|uniref:tetratricopeptide repeat protein n=1 Tax=Tautonia sp. JC769 TaxID=3232135 RepID=UPI00345915B7
MSRSMFRVSAAVLCALVLGGCARERPDTEAHAETEEGTSLSGASVGSPPTDDECWEYGAAFEEALLSSDPGALSRLIDWQAVVDQATRGIDAPADVKRNFSRGFLLVSQAGYNGLVNGLIETTSQGGRCTPLRLIGDEDRRGIRIRLLYSDGALSYLDCYLARRADGSIKAVDVLPYGVGETIVQSARHGYLTTVARSQRDLIDRLTGKDRELIAYLPTLSQMNVDLQAGQYEAVLTAYRSLPESLQKERLFLVLRFSAAAEIDDDDAYAAALADFLEYFPNDPGVDLLMIDSHVLRGEFDEALAAIDRGDRGIGGDPYMHLLRARVHIERENVIEARAAISRAIEEEPSLVEAYWALLDLTITQEDFEETARLLDLMAKKFGIEFNDLAQVPEFTAFVASPHYNEWIARQPTSMVTPEVEPNAPDNPPSEAPIDH